MHGGSNDVATCPYDEDEGDGLAEDEARCVCCCERVLKVQAVEIDGDTVCLECKAEIEAEDTEPGVK